MKNNREVNVYELQYALKINISLKTVKIFGGVLSNGAQHNRGMISREVSDFLHEHQEKTVIKEKKPTVTTVLYDGNPIIFGFAEETVLDIRRTKIGVFKTKYAILNIRRDDDGILSTEIRILGFYTDETAAINAYSHLTDTEKKNTDIYVIVND